MDLLVFSPFLNSEQLVSKAPGSMDAMAEGGKQDPQFLTPLSEACWNI